MAARLTILMFVVVVAAITWACEAQNNDQEVTWAKRVETKNEVITTLQFYFHDILSGQNPTAVMIARPSSSSSSSSSSGSNSSTTLFGNLMMVDDPLTIGPERSSRTVGHARGMYGSAGQTDLGLIMVLNYGFTDGIYDGSSFSMLSINPVMRNNREMAIVGGTGLFRMARGYAIANTYQADPTTGDAVVGYNVTIATYI